MKRCPLCNSTKINSFDAPHDYCRGCKQYIENTTWLQCNGYSLNKAWIKIDNNDLIR